MRAGYYAEEVKNAAIDNGASSGYTTVVAAVPGAQISVKEVGYVCTTATTVTWYSFDGGSTYTKLVGEAGHQDGGGWERPEGFVGYFKTLPGEALVMNVADAVQVGGSLLYQEIGRDQYQSQAYD